MLPREAKWTIDKQADLLGGVIVLKTEALALPDREPAAGLYRRLAAGPLTPQPIQLIPYYAWNNRGSVDMSVWLPLR